VAAATHEAARLKGALHGIELRIEKGVGPAPATAGGSERRCIDKAGG
jgi:hypothetical protein